MRPRTALVTASGVTALLTAAIAIWTAFELGYGNVTGLPRLVWVLIALPLVVAGAVCLAQRRGSSTAPVAVFASSAAACGYAVQLPDGRYGTILAATMLFALCSGVTVVVSASLTAVVIGISGGFSRGRAAVWMAAGLVLIALSIPSPLYIPGGPIQTIFSGNTGGENAVVLCSLVLLTLPLVVAGLGTARIAVIVAVAWLPVAAAWPLSVYVSHGEFFDLDVWYYVSWAALVAVAVLTLAETLGWRSGPGHLHATPPGG